MNTTLIYLLKVNIAIALFYMFYRLFFANDTFWKTRRLYLLASIAISFAYPFFSIASWLQSQEPMQVLMTNYVQLQEFTVTPKTETNYLNLENSMWILYGIVATFLLIRMAIQLISILHIKLKGKPVIVQNINIISIDKAITPFSFFTTIYMNPKLHNEQETKQILTHELTHVRQLHSFDVMISEFLCIAFWINPAAWLIKREIRQNLEYLADNKVIESGFDSKSYQYHLLQLSYQTPNLKLTNKFNILPLKKRIIMMNQQKTNKTGMLKYLLIIPLATTLVLTSNAESIISAAKQNLQLSEKPEPNVEKKVVAAAKPATNKIDEVVVVGYAATEPQNVQKKTENVLAPPPPPASTNDEDVVFQAVEKMPKFPGGDQALFMYLAQNVKYPVAAQEKGIQGRVICSFVVNKEGAISQATVKRSVDPALDAEAIRIINSMPKWEPGMQRGKHVNVQYTLPINFKLDGGKVDRGENSLSAALLKKPLIIVDGEALPANFNFEMIRPESIEKIQVLKDASATATYGEAGKNGVILVTSKK